ncbi:alternate-type signal peptide domain-containing protein [Prescottella agglutinans]|nr:alternate-type signal peptide domain-containing protein [Prescottella agglutinans]
MNKTTKGAIAAGSAALLLAGGAGSFALWNAQADLNAGSINSGTLTLTTQGTPGWSDSHGPVTTWSSFKAVPGDVLTYKADVKIGATGNNLKAALTVDPASITGDAALKAALGTPVVTAKIGGNTVSTITSDNDGNVVNVEVAFTFSGAADNTTQNVSASLSSLALKLQQQ